MSNPIKFFIILTVLVFLGAGYYALAHAETWPTDIAEDAAEAVDLDENIQPEDLEVGEAELLPDHPFYFLKNWGRSVRSFFAFNSVAKIELKAKFSNEKLVELKKMIEEKKNPKAIEKAANNYQKEVEKIKIAAEKIKETAEENPRVEKFLDKYVKHQVLHQRLLQKLENQVPLEVFEKIKEAREAHLERFANVMTKLEARSEKIKEKLEEKMEEIKGSKYKNFKNLEVLLELEEKVPEAAKTAVQKAQENTLKKLQGDLEKMSPEDQEGFKEYLEKIGGVKENQLEILENLKAELKEKPAIQERIIEAREKIIKKVQEGAIKMNCPEIEKPAPDFCEEGRIVAKRDDKGCIVSFGCVIPAEVEIPAKPERPAACITLWDPVCGKNGKTYSNACFAKLAGVEIAYKEKCKLAECQTDADCPQPKCGQPGTLSAKCIGVKAVCVNGECKTVSTIQACKTILCSEGQTTWDTGGVDDYRCPIIRCVPIGKKCVIISPEGICKEYPLSCDMITMGEGWKIVDKCPSIVCEVLITCEPGYTPYDTGEKTAGGCPIKKCVPIEEQSEPEEPTEEVEELKSIEGIEKLESTEETEILPY